MENFRKEAALREKAAFVHEDERNNFQRSEKIFEPYENRNFCGLLQSEETLESFK